MALWSRRPRAMVASAVKRTADNKNETDQARSAWQFSALRHYDNCGEINFCANFYARMLARVRIFPVSISPEGERTELKDGPAAEILNRIQDPGGGRSGLQFDYGRLMFVTGEGVLFATGEQQDERWRFLWREEVVTDDKGVTWRKNAAGKKVEEGTAYRCWRPHPRQSDLAISPLRAVLDVAEELSILTAAVRATAVSRMLNGMLVLPTEVMPPPPDNAPADDPNNNPFLQGFIQHVLGQIEDPTSAAAKIPYLLVASYEYVDQVRWIQMHDPQSDYLERDLRIEAIKRLALGLDLPPEALEGFSNTNHWAAQQIQWDMWRAHGVPIADQFVGDLSDSILRPTLKEEGHDPTKFGVGYDDSQVVVSPDMSSVADEALDRIAISPEGYRQLKGIPETMAPSDEDKAFYAGIKMRDAVVAGLEKEAPPVRGPQPGPEVSTNGKSNVPPQPTGGRTVSRQESMTAGITWAAQMAIRQCRSKAGARLRTKVTTPGKDVKRCPECEQAIDGMENALVASVLGLEVIEQMAQSDPLMLVKGGTDDFRACLGEWGIDKQNSSVLCERIEAYAAKTLFDPNTPDLPPGFAAHVEHALEVSEHVVVH